MKKHPAVAGLFQAVGIALYVTLFAITVQNIGAVEKGTAIAPAIGIMLFLIAFIVSAVVCGSLMFWYPLQLFMKGERKTAVHIVAWAVGWLVAILLTVGIVVVGMG